MEYTAGQVVYSKNGRDKGRPFVVLSVEGDYLYLADGKLRTLEKPKRKKIKHIQPTNFVNKTMQKKLKEQSYILNADIIKLLKEYSNKEAVI